jgi:hypothetical protein
MDAATYISMRQQKNCPVEIIEIYRYAFALNGHSIFLKRAKNPWKPAKSETPPANASP